MKLRNRDVFLCAAILLTLFLAACSRPGGEKYSVQIAPGNFTTDIDNKYFRLQPGRRFTYEGKTDKGVERIEVFVTGKTKKVMGVTTRVVNDKVWLSGKLIEDTDDWYAQDKEGSVWYFGEYSKEIKDGKVTGTKGSWTAGVDGAKPGIAMLAEPSIGDSYRQEYYKGVAEDMGDVVALNQKVSVAFGSFKDCLKTRDWSKIERSLNEYKYYSPDVGFLVLEEAVSGKERVELMAVK